MPPQRQNCVHQNNKVVFVQNKENKRWKMVKSNWRKVVTKNKRGEKLLNLI